MTSKQEKFCQEYVRTGSKSEAYRLAYNAENMKPETVNRKAVEMFEDGKITARVKDLQKKVEKRNEVSVDWVVKKLKEVVDDDDKDRVAALDKLMKHLGGYERNNDQKAKPAFVVFDARNKPNHK